MSDPKQPDVPAKGQLLLQEVATIQEFLIVRPAGKRQVSRAVEHYILDAIISVGYRAKNAVSTRCGHGVADHFVGVNKMVDLGSGSQREIEDAGRVSLPPPVSIPTHKDSLSVRPRDLVRESVVKDSLITAVQSQARDLEQTIAGNVAEILGA